LGLVIFRVTKVIGYPHQTILKRLILPQKKKKKKKKKKKLM
jgi:hypothetical protein